LTQRFSFAGGLESSFRSRKPALCYQQGVEKFESVPYSKLIAFEDIRSGMILIQGERVLILFKRRYLWSWIRGAVADTQTQEQRD
jgi:hypothetical protein